MSWKYSASRFRCAFTLIQIAFICVSHRIAALTLKVYRCSLPPTCCVACFLYSHFLTPFSVTSLSHPASMDPRALCPSNFSTIDNHAKISWSLHHVEDYSSDALSNGVAPICISIPDSWPVINVSFHHAPPFSAFNKLLDPATVPLSLSGWCVWVVKFTLLMSTLFSPKFLCNWSCTDLVCPVLAVFSIVVVLLVPSEAL